MSAVQVQAPVEVTPQDIARLIYDKRIALDKATEVVEALKAELTLKGGVGKSYLINDRGAKVEVTNGGEGGPTGNMTPVFDAAAFAMLDAKTQDKLKKLGVVSMKAEVKKATAPQVKVTIR